MPVDTTFKTEAGDVLRAVLIPARVQFFRLPAGEGAVEHAVGTVDKEQVTADPPIPSKNLFGEEILHEGAAPWARKLARELLGG